MREAEAERKLKDLMQKMTAAIVFWFLGGAMFIGLMREYESGDGGLLVLPMIFVILGIVFYRNFKSQSEKLKKEYPDLILNFKTGKVQKRPGTGYTVPVTGGGASDARWNAAVARLEKMDGKAAAGAVPGKAGMTSVQKAADKYLKKSGDMDFKGIDYFNVAVDMIKDPFVTLLQKDNPRPQACYMYSLLKLKQPTEEGYESADITVDVRTGMAYIQNFRMNRDETPLYYYTPLDWDEAASYGAMEEYPEAAELAKINESNWKDYVPEREMKKRLADFTPGPITGPVPKIADSTKERFRGMSALYLEETRTDGGGMCFLRRTGSGWRLFTASSVDYFPPQITPAMCTEQTLMEILYGERFAGIADYRDRLLDKNEELFLFEILKKAFPRIPFQGKFAADIGTLTGTTMKGAVWMDGKLMPGVRENSPKILHQLTMLGIRGAKPADTKKDGGTGGSGAGKSGGSR